jgi:hypothetical protein
MHLTSSVIAACSLSARSSNTLISNLGFGVGNPGMCTLYFPCFCFCNAIDFALSMMVFGRQPLAPEFWSLTQCLSLRIRSRSQLLLPGIFFSLEMTTIPSTCVKILRIESGPASPSCRTRGFQIKTFLVESSAASLQGFFVSRTS